MNSVMAWRRSYGLAGLMRNMRSETSSDQRGSTSTAVKLPKGADGISNSTGWSSAKATGCESATMSTCCSMASRIAERRAVGWGTANGSEST